MDDQQKQINKAAYEGLNQLVTADGVDAMLQPITEVQALHDRGLITPEGKATPKGVLFTQLQEEQIFDDSGALTKKGLAYSMPYEKTLAPEHLETFLYQKEHGLTEEKAAGVMDVASGLADFLWDAGAAINKAPFVYADAVADYFSPWASENEKTKSGLKLGLAATSAVEGTIQATKQLYEYAGVGASLAVTGVEKMMGDDDLARLTMGRSQQDLARSNHELSLKATGDTIEALTGFAYPAEVSQAAKDTLPADEYASTEKQFSSAGQLIDPTLLIPSGAAAKVAKFGVITRVALKADALIVRAAVRETKIAAKTLELANLERSALAAENTSSILKQLAERATSKFEMHGDQLMAKRATRLQEIAVKTAETAANHKALMPEIARQIELETAAKSAARPMMEEAAARKFMASVELGRQAAGYPLEKMSQLADAVGTRLISANTGLTKVSEYFGGGAAANILKTGVGFAGYAAGGIPGLAAAGTVLAAGPVLRSASAFGRVVGKELTKARGQIPFWQRVANYSELSPLHRGIARGLDTATWGGAVPNAVRAGVRGTLAAYPIDLAFQALADGGEVNGDTFSKALGQSLVLGGSTGMLGGMLHGTKKMHQELARGDELSFRRDIEDVGQAESYQSLPPSTRRAIATYSASNPQLNFQFTTEGPSHFRENTATINIKSDNPLKALIAHEVMHHVVIRNQNEEGVIALMLGDGHSGGLLRSSTGALDPNFAKFHGEYNRRNQAIGKADISQTQAALEYYVDAAADHVAEMAHSGELGVISSRPDVQRGITAIVKSTVARIPIIRDMHFKTGGLLDSQGVMVQGNGLLSDGIRELPAMRAMTRDMLNHSSGRSQGLFEPTGNGRNDTGGATIHMKKGDKHLTDNLISIAETEQVDGKTVVKYDKNGEPVMLSKAEDKKRAEASHKIDEVVKERKKSGVATAKGEITTTPSGDFVGVHLGDDVLMKMDLEEIGNASQRRILNNINTSVREFKGDRFTVISHPATAKIRGKINYKAHAATIRDTVPLAVIPTKQGHLLIGLMSVTQLLQNVETRISSKRGKRLYEGNRELLLNDLSEVMELHRQDKTTTAFFNEKYGASKGKEYKQFCNTVFGLMTPGQQDINPLFHADKVGYKDNVYKTYRWDRIDSATKMSADTHGPMPFVYGSARDNLMPNGLPNLDLNGEIAK